VNYESFLFLCLSFVFLIYNKLDNYLRLNKIIVYLVQRQEKFSKILVAVDGSETSINAAGYAIAMAKKDNAQLIVLTVIVKENDKVEAQQWFDKIGKKAQENNIQLKTEIIDIPMSVEGAILNYAESENVDLIVIGTRGRSGITKMLLGSVASEVVTYATCPVMVVK
jgi:nucleotide-binding universal stress UspA family protein